MFYPIAIEPGTDTTAYGVVVPDLPGCYSAGDTIDEALSNAREAIELYLEDAIDAGKAPPAASRVEDLRRDRTYAGWTWALVDVDLAKLSSKATRVNITIPDRLLGVIDSYASRRGENRSGFLVRAALEVMAARPSAAATPIRKATARPAKTAIAGKARSPKEVRTGVPGKQHIGASFDSFSAAEGTLQAAEKVATRRVNKRKKSST